MGLAALRVGGALRQSQHNFLAAETEIRGLPDRTLLCYNTTRQLFVSFIGESYSGSIAVSKTVHGGSNPSSPAQIISKNIVLLILGV